MCLFNFLLLCPKLAACAQPAARSETDPQQQPEPAARDKKKEKQSKKSAGKASIPAASPAKPAGGDNAADEPVEVTADRQSRDGDIYLYEGYVNALQGEMRLQADRVTLNTVTGDMTADGNVVFDQGPEQRVTARRAELNWQSHKGTFWDTTGFTNRTQTGEYIFFNAARVDKTGVDTYEMYDAEVTACEDVVPKWTFKARRAELKMGDRVQLHNSVFRVKTLPVFVLPYMWIPATRKERKSGFLLPTTGSSNQKGRTLKTAYYQTLGDSADITFRGDIYTQRGLGFGAEFRAATGEKSFLRLGVFTVKDRIFGPPGENDGGTAVVGEGVQYLPNGWLAVGSLSLVTSLRFRQVFSDDIKQVIDPRRESQFYANNKTHGMSLNFLASNETTTLFRPSADATQAGTEVDVKIRQAPAFDLTVYPRRMFDNLPIYLSVDSSIGALKREESVNTITVLTTPAAVQRFDVEPKITVPLATFAGIAVTPSVAFRETFYTSSVDPQVPRFDPDKFTLDPADPRLDPNNSQFQPGLMLYDRNKYDPIVPKSISRAYAELAVDVRPPSLEKTYNNEDGTERFKHVIESYITYRRIDGVGSDFGRIILFDDRDVVANTNEFEYAVVNRIFVKSSPYDLGKRAKRGRPGESLQIKPVRPQSSAIDQKDEKSKPADKPGTETSTAQPSQTGEEKKQGVEQGQQAELKSRTKRDDQAGKNKAAAAEQADQTTAGNIDEPEQARELLSFKVAQKYFFDRDFGGALVEGHRNQFYPINTLSGFTFGGVKRAFSPVDISVRYRPLSFMFADVRMDIGSTGEGVRNLTFSGGVRGGNVTVTASYDLSRRIELAPNQFEAGTFPGNQVFTVIRVGDEFKGLYGAMRIGYDFTDRFTGTGISKGRLTNSRSYIGYAWDCCGVQLNYSTFKAGLRNESALSFTFTLAGLGSYGSDQFSQLGGGQGGRRRGKKRSNQGDDSDFP